MGSVYRRGKIWWIKFYKPGCGDSPVRMSSRSEKREDAEKLLSEAHGLPPKTIKLTPRAGAYCLYDASTGLTKIGQSGDIPKRIRAIQNVNPGALTLIAYVFARDPHMAEQILHHRLRAKRVRLEWFSVSLDELFDAAYNARLVVPLLLVPLIVPGMCPGYALPCETVQKGPNVA